MIKKNYSCVYMTGMISIQKKTWKFWTWACYTESSEREKFALLLGLSQIDTLCRVLVK